MIIPGGKYRLTPSAHYHVDGDVLTPVDASIFYRLGLFELKEQDVHALTLDERHIPQPIIPSRCHFNLPLTSTIRLVILLLQLLPLTL